MSQFNIRWQIISFDLPVRIMGLCALAVPCKYFPIYCHANLYPEDRLDAYIKESCAKFSDE